MKKLLVVLVVMICSATFALAMTLETKKGPVEFDHVIHNTAVLGGCVACHAVEDVAAKKASHTFCKGCHKELEKGPTNCKQCHPN